MFLSNKKSDHCVYYPKTDQKRLMALSPIFMPLQPGETNPGRKGIEKRIERPWPLEENATAKALQSMLSKKYALPRLTNKNFQKLKKVKYMYPTKQKTMIYFH